MKRLLTIAIMLFTGCAAFAQAPVALNDTVAVPKNTSTIIPVTENDTSFNGQLSVSILQQAKRGTVEVINLNQVNYTPAPFYYGPDSFSYITCDATPQCDTATVYITVTGSNAPPVAADDEFVLLDTANILFLPVDTNDVDPETEGLEIRLVGGFDTNEMGAITVDTITGKLLFARSLLACGTDSFQYQVCDRFDECDTATVVITINCPDVIFRPQGFSPNGDGKNDQLVFTGLEYFAPALLKVFNRFGNSVYESEDYQNDWQGTNRENGKPLPDGTYYYTLELPTKQRYTSYLIISR